MTTPAVLILRDKLSRQLAASWALNAPIGTSVEFRRHKRSLPQNKRLHAMCTDVARQVEWAGKKRDVEAWKDIFTAAYRSAKHDLDVVPGINGGFVLLGMHTSQLSAAECTDVMEIIAAFGAEHGVEFTDGQGSEAGTTRPEMAA